MHDLYDVLILGAHSWHFDAYQLALVELDSIYNGNGEDRDGYHYDDYYDDCEDDE